jgi:hypothetical protein
MWTATVQTWWVQAELAAYRLSAHAMLNWMDDPALLAIVFC